MTDIEQGPFDVFLSHAHVDADLVEQVGIRLEDQAGLTVWLDRWVLVPGQHWQQEMAKGLHEARTCAVCVGEQTPSGWFREEIERALNRQTKDTSFRVIPVVLPHGNSEIIDNFLELRTWVHFEDGIDDDYAFHLLKCGVKGISPGRYRKSNSSKIDIDGMRKALRQIRELRKERLIDDDIALEYQRRILDRITKV
jgi:hypothetical protein